ncbi:prepilin-type N-terminal cleavage/methylation domain-containing protein [Halobacteroides halobius]|nr:prepilin-type N-terminal cleavage/methylation domain-containing protein [Halobacteroides halobius]
MKNYNQGFTLVELLVVLVMISIVSIIIIDIHSIGWKFYQFNYQQVNLQQQARLIISQLEEQIRQADKLRIKSDFELIIKQGKQKYIRYYFNSKQETVYYQVIDGLGAWPGSRWDNIDKLSIAFEEVKEIKFKQSANQVIIIDLILANQNQSYKLSNHQVYPRYYKMEGTK